MLNKFFNWYNRNYLLNLSIAGGLFLLQIIHLIWLFSDVITYKIFGQSFIDLKGFWEYMIVLVDYTEIPALLTTTLLYINEFRNNKKAKDFMFIVLVNSQWLHLFWITDEFVVEALTQNALLPVWLAWIAIAIDYLELPVIFDVLKKIVQAVKQNKLTEIKAIITER